MTMEKSERELLIATLKEKFGEIFIMRAEGEEFIFRLLTRKEYNDILSITDDKEKREEIICQLAVIYPTGLNFATGGAGWPSLIAPTIVNESGYGELTKSVEYFEHYKSEMNGFEFQVEAIIQAAFPQITEEEMREWTVSKLMRMAAKAEWILSKVHGYPIGLSIEANENEEEDGEPVEPPTFKELGDEARRNGLDPMYLYKDFILEPRPFAEFPFIAGVEYWRKVFK